MSKPRKEPITKVCPSCLQEFECFFNKKKYCSSACSHRGSYNAHMMDYKWRLSKLLGMAKNRSETLQVDFDLDHQFLIDLWDKAEGCCVMTGFPFELERSEFGKVNPKAPSIDRIIPELGYTKGNVRLVTYQTNMAMNEFGEQSLKEFCIAFLERTGGVSNGR